MSASGILKWLQRVLGSTPQTHAPIAKPDRMTFTGTGGVSGSTRVKAPAVPRAVSVRVAPTRTARELMPAPRPVEDAHTQSSQVLGAVVGYQLLNAQQAAEPAPASACVPVAAPVAEVASYQCAAPAAEAAAPSPSPE